MGAPEFEFDGGPELGYLVSVGVVEVLEECEGVVGIGFEGEEDVFALLDGLVVRLGDQFEGLSQL